MEVSSHALDQGRVDLAAEVNGKRAGQTMAALQEIAAHVANIPGRKNLGFKVNLYSRLALVDQFRRRPVG